MIEYYIIFESNCQLILTHEEFKAFSESEQNQYGFIVFLDDNGRPVTVNTSKILYIIAREKVSKEEGVVTPKEPQTLKDEEEAERQVRVSSLSNVIEGRGDDGQTS